MSTYKLFFKILFLFVVYSSTAFSVESDVKQEIVHLLHKWPQDFNEKNIRGVCGLFANDLVASYSGSKDRNYEEMCRNFLNVLTDSEKIYHYEAPKIEQILVGDNIVAVRLVWTLKVTNKNKSDVDVIKEKGLDIFKRQSDGSWKIAISYAYPITD